MSKTWSLVTVTFYQVGVKVNDGSGAVSVSVTPRESLCDGEFHAVKGTTSHADNITQTWQYVSSSKFQILLLSSSSVQTTWSYQTKGGLQVWAESRPLHIHLVLNNTGYTLHWR